MAMSLLVEGVKGVEIRDFWCAFPKNALVHCLVYCCLFVIVFEIIKARLNDFYMQ